MIRNTLSIIIIGYNEGENLHRCLASVIDGASEFQRITGEYPEILFVDAQSTDNSVGIALELGIRVAQAPSGFKTCTNNRMTGILLTDSDFIMFLDGDMEIERNWLVTGINYLKNDQNKKIAGVAGIRNDMRLLSTGKYQYIPNYNQIKNPIEHVDRDIGGAFLLRRIALSDINGLEPDLAPEEDFYMFCKLKKAGWNLCRMYHPMITHWNTKLSSFRQTFFHIIWNKRVTVPGVILREALLRQRFALMYLWHFKRKTIRHFFIFITLFALLIFTFYAHSFVIYIYSLIVIIIILYIRILWNEKGDMVRILGVFVLQPIYFLHLLVGFILNYPKLRFGIQMTMYYRDEVFGKNKKISKVQS